MIKALLHWDNKAISQCTGLPIKTIERFLLTDIASIETITALRDCLSRNGIEICEDGGIRFDPSLDDERFDFAICAENFRRLCLA